MELEDYFHRIQRKEAMNTKDTRVSFMISQDNDDIDDYPNTSHSMNNEYNGATWMQLVEDVVRIIEASYGYEIRSKIYYVVDLPLFDHNISPAPGREINRAVFMKLLKKYPELNNGGNHQDMDTFFTEVDDEDNGNS